VGFSATALYVALIAWLFTLQPQSMAEVTGGLSASVGAYRIDQQAFDDALRLFRQDQFEAAVSAFERADAAKRDARTQFYLAYTYYRRGWGRVYHDDAWFAKGLEAVNRAIAVAPNGRIVIDDPNLKMRSGDELKAELEAGLRRDLADLNPFRLLRERK
jgi:tetratricopeptide (TPR) repeat protein